ncbi:beta (1-3) glucanosyltransferase [Ophiostoma piceae UAMH 11346]|uniref:1,3-beta-glucanosyltransferase n=1 Tax=Ophiostoma piceae (strain UAMH 11346) TaxID=1262450 RepID=S3D298_OPHP1|nr:beta (1-3) glucanosyltransferase [Ophiostoma piceae UAMH 11346]
MKVSTLTGALVGSAAFVRASVPTISAVGNKFFTEDGSQFFIKGVAYQLSPDDPLIDGDQCARDVELMKTLGVNTIRVYHVDATANHDSCMSALADAGIYTLIDLDTFTSYILSPTVSGASWTQDQYDSYAAVIDAFAGYDNVLGFFVGNEVIAQASQSQAAPYIKAAAADMKAYRDKKKYRNIPIGYSAADIAELRPMLQDYLTCGGKPEETIDFFSLNSYEWCDPSTYATSGYTNLEAMAKDYPVPIFFSETGCNTPGPRTFDDQTAIFGPEMNADWSGSIIYEWIQEANNYGLITYGNGEKSDNAPRSGTPKPMTPDFANLKAQWATLTPKGVASADYDPKSVSTRDCPASTASGWLVDGNVPLPTVGSDVTYEVPSNTPASGAAAPTSTAETGKSAATGKTAGTGTAATGTAATGTAATGTATTGTSTKSATGTAASSAATGAASSFFQASGASAILAGAVMALTLLL